MEVSININALPDVIWTHIFESLDSIAIGCVRLVCKNWLEFEKKFNKANMKDWIEDHLLYYEINGDEKVLYVAIQNFLRNFDTDAKFSLFPTWGIEDTRSFALDGREKLFKLAISCGAPFEYSIATVYAIENNDHSILKVLNDVNVLDPTLIGMVKKTHREDINSVYWKILRSDNALNVIHYIGLYAACYNNQVIINDVIAIIKENHSIGDFFMTPYSFAEKFDITAIINYCKIVQKYDRAIDDIFGEGIYVNKDVLNISMLTKCRYGYMFNISDKEFFTIDVGHCGNHIWNMSERCDHYDSNTESKIIDNPDIFAKEYDPAETLMYAIVNHTIGFQEKFVYAESLQCSLIINGWNQLYPVVRLLLTK